jgi:general secretion pathway protein D
MKQPLLSIAAITGLLTLAGCANPALDEADRLTRTGQLPQAMHVLNDAVNKSPHEPELRSAQVRTRDLLVSRLVMQIDGLRRAGRWEEARAAVQQLREADPKTPRLAWLEAEVERGERQEAQLLIAGDLLKQGKLDQAEATARTVLIESPQNASASRLISQVAQARPEQPGVREMGPAFQKPVTLQLRDAQLRQVFEALARTNNVNFVFDKEVLADAKVTVFLRDVSLDEAMRVILSAQQLDRKLLNENTLLIYPNTPAKQREHRELVSRTFYLTNADAKLTEAMVRTIAKVHDAHIDERLNLLVLRDTPEVLQLAEKLIAAADLPEPEVMLDVEVIELSTDHAEELGLQWPDKVSYGLPGLSNGDGSSSAQVQLGQHKQFRASIANPAVVATLHGTSSDVNVLANPKIRARNHDKAKVQIGEKVPVFTTTTNFTGSTSVAASVSYLDVGIKLEVEPSVQLDNDVVIKIGLEVSNLINQVTGPGGTTAYEVGTRQTSTTLRLADGETQVLAGLINDEDRRSSDGIPGLSRMPLLGALFGTQSGSHSKSEVVLLITPHIVRNLALPDSANVRFASGTDASPGAFSTRLKPAAQASASGVTVESGSAATPVLALSMQSEQPSLGTTTSDAVVRLDAMPQVPAGGTAAATLRNLSAYPITGELSFDASKMTPVQAAAGSAPGRYPVSLAPQGSTVIMFRASPDAGGQSINLKLDANPIRGMDGTAILLRIEGTAVITVVPTH